MVQPTFDLLHKNTFSCSPENPSCEHFLVMAEIPVKGQDMYIAENTTLLKQVYSVQHQGLWSSAYPAVTITSLQWLLECVLSCMITRLSNGQEDHKGRYDYLGALVSYYKQCKLVFLSIHIPYVRNTYLHRPRDICGFPYFHILDQP